MMTRTQYLLNCLAEECAEVAQRASKAARFGLDEAQLDLPEDFGLTNAVRIEHELADLLAVYNMLQFENSGLFVTGVTGATAIALMDAKQRKVEKYLKYAISRGQVEPG